MSRQWFEDLAAHFMDEVVPPVTGAEIPADRVEFRIAQRPLALRMASVPMLVSGRIHASKMTA
jgi:hypothetical protein